MQSQERPQQAQRPQIVVQSFEDFQTNCFLLEMNLSRARARRLSRSRRGLGPFRAARLGPAASRLGAPALRRSRVTVARLARFRARRPDRPGA